MFRSDICTICNDLFFSTFAPPLRLWPVVRSGTNLAFLWRTLVGDERLDC
jgi:hypothetical protein